MRVGWMGGAGLGWMLRLRVGWMEGLSKRPAFTWSIARWSIAAGKIDDLAVRRNLGLRLLLCIRWTR